MVVAAVIATTSHSLAHPVNETDHGVNESTHATLWSGDTDTANLTALATASGDDESPSELRLLAAGTDIPLDAPSTAVEQWNEGELTEFPETGPSESVYPARAAPVDGRFIADAHTTLVTVQPSTRARLSVGDAPLYVADRGEVLGVVDYRVAVPRDDRTGLYRVSWRLADHEITETRLLINNTVVARSDGTRTPSLGYDLTDAADELRTVTLEAEIAISLIRTTRIGDRTCETVNNTTSCSTTWSTSLRTIEETQTVSDSVDVIGYELDVSGARTQYPNGDVGVALYKNQPWLGYSLGEGSVSGVWRFYSARDPSWDTLTRSDGTRETAEHSPIHPLQVHAYPIETGPTAAPRSHIEIVETYGEQVVPPTLPENINLDVLSEPYTASYGIATRSTGVETDSWKVTARGLVGGERVVRDASDLPSVPMNRSNLTLAIENTSTETITVRLDLRDAGSGAPIDTSERNESIHIADREIDTGPDGTATVTLDRDVGGVSARYEPRPWWFGGTAYVGDSDAVYPRGVVLQTVRTLFEFAVPLAVLLFGVFVIDRLTGWAVWPPWRGL